MRFASLPAAFHRAVWLDAFGLVDESLPTRRAEIDTTNVWDVIERDSDALTMDSRIADAYNQEAFRYFLQIERRRAELSGRPFLLLLIDLNKRAIGGAPLCDGIADSVFDVLSSCLRDTDFVGWFREGRIAGGVLTQDSADTDSANRDRVLGRVRAALATNLPAQAIHNTRVRVFQLPATKKSQR
jgi:hypothetical protein